MFKKLKELKEKIVDIHYEIFEDSYNQKKDLIKIDFYRKCNEKNSQELEKLLKNVRR